MTYQDFSSEKHRLDNMDNMRFVRAYARVRHHLLEHGDRPDLQAFLTGYMEELERQISIEMGFNQEMLVNRLVNIGDGWCQHQDAEDEAE